MPPTSLAPEQTKTQVEENLLTPRFYTTDFAKAAAMDWSPQESELQAMLAEMRADYNRFHFVRNEEFKRSWDHITGEDRQAFLDYLERSCVSEFSGFLLFKELSRKLKDKNPLLAEIFHLMARDEARHAGFLNKAMGDFKLSLDLGALTKRRTYTFFPVEWIIYAVYLSEKIGYWRYILIHRHLQCHPENRFYPLFNYFESWCQDENRHGDIFKALLRSQPKMWKSLGGRLWSRFFLLSVFATHTMTVEERAKFYDLLGLEAEAFDREVIRQTNDTAARCFPIKLNVDHPQFFRRLSRCSRRNQALKALAQQPRFWGVKLMLKGTLMAGMIWDLIYLYWLKPIDVETSRGTIR
ncbi:magnesium-protoporphyrin IX monomethyl ester (oxidative) cyclase [Lyngbya confervoides]|uniref:Magnesium-protoporphyrin IX monomethyl ester [oxidative] cyclase n=1 Tax=Lyngbya confervoides BDU141951 TaxID=1574623 RepID=A0ABD4T587_9CYAN|nr:magnesium-protoporphyrin IX monomethyl ester (oxidative) cyclase [Lyngbya confervoides]MCM1983829.1 magnesium-protoporphyrin IX monomethyl ester (oxidative) cyclase [Lyngbya confervoides BDU141951]